MLTALRHPACAGQQRRLPEHGPGLPMPRRRTFATSTNPPQADRCPLSFAHSMLTALRHPACDDQSAADRCPSNAGSRDMGSPSRMPDQHGTWGGGHTRSPPASAGGFYGIHTSPERERWDMRYPDCGRRSVAVRATVSFKSKPATEESFRAPSDQGIPDA